QKGQPGQQQEDNRRQIHQKAVKRDAIRKTQALQQSTGRKETKSARKGKEKAGATIDRKGTTRSDKKPGSKKAKCG
ncbi:hypothetical protein, partial [Klebsiella pneumoniae]|uniref:hypothetical protein n=1 Tax=Klebsiella pneumoniae TaxID=573 RepID=UPI003B5A032E